MQRAVLYAWTVLETYGPFCELPKTSLLSAYKSNGGEHVCLCAANFIVFMYVFCWVPPPRDLQVTGEVIYMGMMSAFPVRQTWSVKQPFILATASVRLIKIPWSGQILLRYTQESVRKPRAADQPRQSPHHLSHYTAEPPSFCWGP